jgi:hypothetical protein
VKLELGEGEVETNDGGGCPFASFKMRRENEDWVWISSCCPRSFLSILRKEPQRIRWKMIEDRKQKINIEPNGKLVPWKIGQKMKIITRACPQSPFKKSSQF